MHSTLSQRERKAPLGGNADKFAHRHGQSPSNKTRHTSKHDVVQLVAATFHAQHQRRYAHKAIVGSQDAGSQPGRSSTVVLMLVGKLRLECNCLALAVSATRERLEHSTSTLAGV